MKRLSEEEIERIIYDIPIAYQDVDVLIYLDYRHEQHVVITNKYRLEWFWRGHTLRIYDKSSLGMELFLAQIDDHIGMFCKVDEETQEILHCSAENVDLFVERLLKMRVFL